MLMTILRSIYLGQISCIISKAIYITTMLYHYLELTRALQIQKIDPQNHRGNFWKTQILEPNSWKFWFNHPPVEKLAFFKATHVILTQTGFGHRSSLQILRHQIWGPSMPLEGFSTLCPAAFSLQNHCALGARRMILVSTHKTSISSRRFWKFFHQSPDNAILPSLC